MPETKAPGSRSGTLPQAPGFDLSPRSLSWAKCQLNQGSGTERATGEAWSGGHAPLLHSPGWEAWQGRLLGGLRPAGVSKNRAPDSSCLACQQPLLSLGKFTLQTAASSN